VIARKYDDRVVGLPRLLKSRQYRFNPAIKHSNVPEVPSPQLTPVTLRIFRATFLRLGYVMLGTDTIERRGVVSWFLQEKRTHRQLCWVIHFIQWAVVRRVRLEHVDVHQPRLPIFTAIFDEIDGIPTQEHRHRIVHGKVATLSLCVRLVPLVIALRLVPLTDEIVEVV
ncbi:uncharacterized protein METZ01_LOCUS287968, partial [marine metagenome]